MNILHISAECFPIAKVGGLADVVGALPQYQNKIGVKSKVVMPYYNNAFVKKRTWEKYFSFDLNIENQRHTVEILKGNLKLGFELFLVKIKGFTDREEVYGYDDDYKRFLAFQLAVLDFVTKNKWSIDVFHCHDHHTGLIPFLMSYADKFQHFKNTPSVFTIHNAQYQGQFGFEHLHLFPEFENGRGDILDWNGTINPLAAGIKSAWKVNTVSPTYMEELKLKANGLEKLLSYESEKCMGILNGIDTKVWDAATDRALVKNYAQNNIQSGKKANKRMLCKKFNLDENKPLVAFIGRLVYEKGADLFPDIFADTLSKGRVNILLLGSGQDYIESELRLLLPSFQGCYNAYFGYDEQLAHQIYAGADFILMPSRVEPCGLNQMYALKYGTIPVVRRTGGLADTVIDIGDGGFGICHNHASVDDVCHAMDRIVEFYEDQINFRKIRKKTMRIDHSWVKSAKEYVTLYESLKIN